MPDSETLSHTKWDCKSHRVFLPQSRRKALSHELRRHLGAVVRALAEPREGRLEEGHLMPDHGHGLLSIPPKYSVAQGVGFIQGKAALHSARTCMGRRQNSTGHHFWARGDDVSTGGRDEATIRESSRTQEAEDRRWDHRGLWYGVPPSGGSLTHRFERFTVALRFERFRVFQASGFAGGR
jgi:putative transposase